MAGIRDPDHETEFVSEDEILVTVYVDNLIPKKSKVDTQEAKNGTVIIDFFKQSFNMTATVKESNNKETISKLNIVRLPSRIDLKRVSWKLEPGEVRITMFKEKEVAEDGSESYVDWKSKIRSRGGLDQYNSSEDEEQNAPDPMKVELKSKCLEELGLNVAHGHDNTYHVDVQDLKHLKL